jgi:hypothetical protein
MWLLDFLEFICQCIIFAQLQHTQFMCGLIIIHIQMHVILIPGKDHALKKIQVYHEYWLHELCNLWISKHTMYVLWWMCHCNKYCYNILDTMFLFQLTQHEIHVALIDLHICNVKTVWLCIKFVAFENFLKKCISMCDKQPINPNKISTRKIGREEENSEINIETINEIYY